MIPVCEQCGQPINTEYEEWTVSEDNEPIHIDCIELRNGGGQVNEFRQHLKKYDEYEAKNKELLEELKYLKKINDDLVWQRDTDEEHEAKAKAWDKYKTHMESHIAGEINEEELVSDLKSDYFESGEPNAKK